MESIDNICSSCKSLYRDFLSTRPTRLEEPPLVSLLLSSRGGLMIDWGLTRPSQVDELVQTTNCPGWWLVYTKGVQPHCSTINCTPLYYTAPHFIVLHWNTLHWTLLHCNELHYRDWHIIALQCTALHYTALYCIALHCQRMHQAGRLYNLTHFTALNCTS